SEPRGGDRADGRRRAPRALVPGGDRRAAGAAPRAACGAAAPRGGAAAAGPAADRGRRMTRVARAAAAAAVLGLALGAGCSKSSSSGGGPAPGSYDSSVAGTIAVPSAGHGKLVAPGASVELEVVLTDPGGAPLAGKGIYFVAPPSGPSGTFAGADPAA